MSWGMIAVAGATLVSGVVGANKQEKAAEQAAAAQSGSAQLGIDETRRQFDVGVAEANQRFEQLQSLLKPYVTAGNGALGGQQDLLGLNGGAAQMGAVNGIQQSPQFAALAQQGEDAILANASATGGLRGGNVQASLAQFRPQLLSQLIDQQYQRLGGLTSLGQNSAAFTGNSGLQTGQGIAGLGANAGTQVANLLAQQGSAQAGAALASGRANGQMATTAGNAFGQFVGGGGLNSLFSSPTGVASGTVDNTLF